MPKMDSAFSGGKLVYKRNFGQITKWFLAKIFKIFRFRPCQAMSLKLSPISLKIVLFSNSNLSNKNLAPKNSRVTPDFFYLFMFESSENDTKMCL